MPLQTPGVLAYAKLSVECNASLQCFPKVFEELFRDKRSQMEGRLRGEAPERAKYGVIDEQLQRVERQLKDGGVIMDAGERGRNKVAQLKSMLDVKATQPRPLHRLNPPKVNKYLRKEHNKASEVFIQGLLSCLPLT